MISGRSSRTSARSNDGRGRVEDTTRTTSNRVLLYRENFVRLKSEYFNKSRKFIYFKLNLILLRLEVFNKSF